ncbi:hypothetical protein [Kitasatospora sp. GAS204B]|uniref:hypothetical protein n=1 Tax=unclassified Kitasatospora TaxID=2633591 RepID=UPI002473DFF8|nr:hypothetical protein [Kitasatospora sp. GAS204B]MDH6118297.1 hypothetical protein [Kitasatospora sp. GAS204B]
MSNPTPRSPFDRRAALTELRALGRQLDQQVANRSGTTPDELDATLDATLDAMRAVHARIIADQDHPA